MSDKKILNGVNVDDLSNTIDAIKEQSELAKFKFRSRNFWINGGHNRTSVKDFDAGGKTDTSRAKGFLLDADEPAVLLGEDNGPNPVELVLHALASCLTTSLVYHAAARGIKLDAVESTLEGDLDLRGFLGMTDQVRNGYEKIRVSFNIESSAPEEMLRELCELAQSRSPVFDIVTNPVPVSVTLEADKPVANGQAAI